MYYIWQIHTCSLFSQLEELILSSAGNSIVGVEVTGGTDLFFSHDFVSDLTIRISLAIPQLA